MAAGDMRARGARVMTYRFALLPRDPIPPGAPVLGIDVSAEHVDACNLGNLAGLRRDDLGTLYGLDPSLRGDDARPELWSGRAAVDTATEIPPPPDGTILAVSRIDLGTVAAL